MFDKVDNETVVGCAAIGVFVVIIGVLAYVVGYLLGSRNHN